MTKLKSTAMRDKHFIKSLIGGALYAIGLFVIFLFIRLFMGDNGFWNYLSCILGIVVFVFLYAWQRSIIEKTEPERNPMYNFFFYGIRIIILITLLVGLWGIYTLMMESDCASCAVFQAVGMGLVIIWACIFLSYFIWALYYYNINFGLTEEEWDKIKEAKEKKRKGDHYLEEDIDDKPLENPYKDETFGLPPGTVRGMIAFTLLFGALAMLVVSIGMSNEISPNSLFYDQYDFFKTAFLMMIAFYFGTRSLQYLKSNHIQETTAAPKEPQSANPATPPANPIINKPVSEVVDPMLKPDPVNQEQETTDDIPQPDPVLKTDKPMAGQVFDPMNP